MAVRPFWIEADIDGRQTKLSGGTKRSDGDHTIVIYQRDKGEKTIPFKIRQYSTEDLNEETNKWEHHLHTDVYYQGELIKSHITDY